MCDHLFEIITDVEDLQPLTSFCSTCSAVFRTSRNWVSCFLSSSCTCFICHGGKGGENGRNRPRVDVRMIQASPPSEGRTIAEQLVLLTVCRSVASFSMEGFRLSTAFRPSWKKLSSKRVNTAKHKHADTKAKPQSGSAFKMREAHIVSVGLTCTVRGSTWWGSAAGPPLSWFWSHWLWGDTVKHIEYRFRQTGWGQVQTISKHILPFHLVSRRFKAKVHLSSKTWSKHNIKRGPDRQKIIQCNLNSKRLFWDVWPLANFDRALQDL